MGEVAHQILWKESTKWEKELIRYCGRKVQNGRSSSSDTVVGEYKVGEVAHQILW